MLTRRERGQALASTPCQALSKVANTCCPVRAVNLTQTRRDCGPGCRVLKTALQCQPEPVKMLQILSNPEL